MTQLSAVHQTLHGKNTAETLSGLIKSLGLHFDLEGQVCRVGKRIPGDCASIGWEGGFPQSAVEEWFHSLERVSEMI